MKIRTLNDTQSESDLINTRIRLRNWGAVYRDRKRVGISPLYVLIKAHEPPEEKAKATLRTLDYDDADIVDRVVMSLPPSDRHLIIGYYCKRQTLYTINRSVRGFLSDTVARIEKIERTISKILDIEK